MVEGDTSDGGKGGNNYKDSIRKYGIPDSETDLIKGDYEIKRVAYLSLGFESKAVILNFAKQENGQFLLIPKFSIVLESQKQHDSGIRI
ncbi:hypothetical protein [Streptococcus mitis]|uniref:hypothetical protein n=1 Tax=Streptococcus mitis TaxID=28037 RepID=UPI0029E816B0|nr:hypothetical protein [Streptococcus mitis]